MRRPLMKGNVMKGNVGSTLLITSRGLHPSFLIYERVQLL